MANPKRREDPAPWPGKAGYPPVQDASGRIIDYSLRENGGVFMKKFVHNNEGVSRQVQLTAPSTISRRRESLKESVHPLGQARWVLVYSGNCLLTFGSHFFSKTALLMSL